MSRSRGRRRSSRLPGPEVRADVDAELRFHLHMRSQELMAAGLEAEAARAEALRQFGDLGHLERRLLALHARHARATRWTERMAALGSALRYAVRRALRAPASSAAVILTFALGIGANAVMFAVVDRLLLRPPAHVVRPGEVARLLIERSTGNGARQASAIMAYPDFLDFARAGSAAVTAFSRTELTLGHGAEARQVNAVLAAGNYFTLLGARPALGRFPGPADDREGSARVAVISFALWQAAYGGEPGAIGRPLDFGYGPFTVVGVAPRDFNGIGLQPVDVWLPLLPAGLEIDGARWKDDRGWQSFEVLARRARAVPFDLVLAELTLLHRQGRASDIERAQYDPQARVIGLPLTAATTLDGSRAAPARVAVWLLGVSGLLLLIACANIANLLLARALRDRREFAIRLALGGSRRRVFGQALAEPLVLAAGGGLTALLLAKGGGNLVRAGLLPGIFWPNAPTDGRVLTLIVLLAVAAGAAAGLLPAVQSSRGSLEAALKRAGSRSHSGARGGARSILTVLQTVVSVVLLIGAGLFVRSLHQARSLDLGLDPRGVLVLAPTFDRDLTAQQRSEFYRRAAERLRVIPGVTGASPDISVPFWNRRGYGLRVPGLDSIPRLATAMHLVEGEYFDLLRLRMLRGRTFQAGDGQAIVVNQTMARLLWPGQDPIGKCVIVIEDPRHEPPCASVIGVVENARVRGLVEAEAMNYYLPTTQRSVETAPIALLARVEGEPKRFAASLRRALLEVDPAVRYVDVQELQRIIDPLTRSWEMGATLFSLFGLLALLVSALGLYGVLAFNVAQRRVELSIRAALGAAPGALIRMVFGQAVRLVSVGIGLGLAIALLVGGRIESLLFRVSPRDPLVAGAVAASLMLTGVLAAWIPARRATRVEPATALQAE